MVSQERKERTRKRRKQNVYAKSLRDGSLNMRVEPDKKTKYNRKKQHEVKDED